VGLIAIASSGPHDWRKLLAAPELHWKPGHSAMALAASWESARGSFPAEMAATFRHSGEAVLQGLEPLLILPEYKVALPGGSRRSQTDVLVVARGELGLVVVTVEGKVSEPFGPTLGEKRADPSPGLQKRLAFLQQVLGTDLPLPDVVRYQLVHRTASSLLVARAFCASAAIMVVHSFSETGQWFGDYAAFAAALGASVEVGSIQGVPNHAQPRLFLSWCSGDPRFLSVDLRVASRSSVQASERTK